MNNTTLLDIIYLIGIVQASFFSLFFFYKKNRYRFDIFAGIWLIAFALDFSLVVLLNETNRQLLIVSNIELLFTLLHGPLLYLYIKYLLTNDDSFKINDLLHFSPFFIVFVYVLLFSADRIAFFIPILGIISGLIYAITSVSIIVRFRSCPGLSVESARTIRWLANLCIGLLVVWILPLIIVNLLRISEPEINAEKFYILVPVFIFYLSFKGINQQLIYTYPTKNDSIKISSAGRRHRRNKGLYSNSTLSDGEMKRIYILLDQQFRERKLFLNPELKLVHLSKSLNIPQHYITQTLNIYSRQNFNDFVNQYRIEEYKQRIQHTNNQNYTLFGVASECGFNSKPTFNRVFKKVTGQTPTEYLAGLKSRNTITISNTGSPQK